MPYKDRLKQKEAVKRAVAKSRVLQKGITVDESCNTLGVIPEAKPPKGITVDVIPHGHDPAWVHIKEFVQRQEPPGTMPYLERLQRIAGSLGKNAHEVRLGALTLEDIGKVIGVMPPVIGKA